MGSLEVINPGIFTSLQDKGRFGYRKFGIPISGAMDEQAMADVNRIVGNPINSPVIECTFEGGKYEFNSDAVIAITGADTEVTINGKEVPRYKSLTVLEGDLLSIGHPKRGIRNYLTIQGSWKAPKVMDSYSTYVLGVFGGFDGRTLAAGDILKWNELDEAVPSISPDIQIPYFSSKLSLHVYPGPEWEMLNDRQKTELLNAEFTVDSTSNRMAIRFSGSSVAHSFEDMKSSAVAPGIIQLPPSGLPILLMKDAQTIGGYPRILYVAEYHLWRAGQLAPGDTVRFDLQNS
ncbi:MAG: biotin-dependent carboxyltransferase family protein [Balneolaceae bacterium]|nr:biotin-dependent carboxyltransferase family protein [Balneolaceae bacterium]